jgi:hypothetical protein
MKPIWFLLALGVGIATAKPLGATTNWACRNTRRLKASCCTSRQRREHRDLRELPQEDLPKLHRCPL